MPFPLFDRSRLRIQPLAQRHNDLDLSVLLPLGTEPPAYDHPALPVLGRRLVEARRQGRARILLMGAHVLRAGVARHLIDLMERGLVDHLAMNGAGPIHDWEFALIGASTESVARYIQTGEFGLWEETGRMNDVIRDGARDGLGLGEAVGRAILDGPFPHKDVSVLAAAARLGVPATVHVGVGYDILHEHPNCDGAALGAASYRDFLVFAQTVTRLEGGVLLNFGSAVMGPEVYLKALAMARNVAHQEGRVDPQLHHRRLRPRAARRRHAPPGAEDRPALLLPAVEDDPGPHRRGRRRELLSARRPPRHRAAPAPGRPRRGRRRRMRPGDPLTEDVVEKILRRAA